MVHAVLFLSSSHISFSDYFSCSQSYPQVVDKKTCLKTSFSKIQLLDLEAFTLNTPLSNGSVLGFLLSFQKVTNIRNYYQDTSTP